MADALSQVTTCLGLEAVEAILDGPTLGASQRAEGENPAIIEGDQQMEKEVWVATGQVLVENACHRLGSSSERRPRAGCSSAMVRV